MRSRTTTPRRLSIPPPSLESTIQDLTAEFAERVVTAMRSTIQELSATFAEEILESVRGSSLTEIVGARTRAGGDAEESHRWNGADPGAPSIPRLGPGRHGRRPREEISRLVVEIVDLCKQHEDGIHAEEMRAMLKIPRREILRPIAVALAEKRIRKTGHKRSTLYFAA